MNRKEKHSCHLHSITFEIRMIQFISLSVLLLLCLLLIFSLRKILIDNASSYANITTRKLETELTANYNSLQSLYINLMQDSALGNLLYSPYSRKSPYIEPALQLLAEYQSYNPHIADIALVSDTVHRSTFFSNEELDEMCKTITDNNFHFIGIANSNFHNDRAASETSLLLFGGRIYYNAQPAGFLIIALRSTSVTLQIPAESKIGVLYLITSHDSILQSFNCSEKEAQKLFELSDISSLDSAQLNNCFSSNARTVSNYSLQYTYLHDMDCFLISAVDIQRAGSNIYNLQIILCSFVTMIIFLTALILLLVTAHLVKPLKRFVKIIADIRGQSPNHFEKPIQLNGCLEIETLSHEFSAMMFDIQALNKRIFTTTSNLYEAKVQKQEAEISYLRSQIDPHFIYNTLEVIRQMAIDKNAPEIADITTNMGKIFRYNAKGGGIVSLEDEIKITKAYVAVQQTRFQGKLKVYYNFPEETHKLQVIKMLLQPLIENAIFHGLEPKGEIGTLFIGSRTDGNNLYISIRDDGIGISAGKLESIRAALASDIYDTSKHVGIINIHARIQLQYGKEYSLQIGSSADDGTTITLHLPAVKNREE